MQEEKQGRLDLWLKKNQLVSGCFCLTVRGTITNLHSLSPEICLQDNVDFHHRNLQTSFYQLDCLIRGQPLCKDKSHKHAAVKRKLTEQTKCLYEGTRTGPKAWEKVFKTLFLETRLIAGFVISRLRLLQCVGGKLLPFEPRQEPTFKRDFVSLSSYWRVCTYCDTGCLLPICSFAFTFANSIEQLIVTGVFVSSLWSSSAWLITGIYFEVVWTADTKKKN